MTLDSAPFLFCLSADVGHASVRPLLPALSVLLEWAWWPVQHQELCMFAARSASLAEPPLDTKHCARHRRGILRCRMDKNHLNIDNEKRIKASALGL